MNDAAQSYSFSLGTYREPSTYNLLIDITEAVCDTGSPAARRDINGLNGELAYINAAIPRPY